MHGKPGRGVYEFLGARIRSMREARGLSLRELCNLSDISDVSLTLIERGWTNITTEALLCLASALRVPVIEFFGDEEDS